MSSSTLPRPTAITTMEPNRSLIHTRFDESRAGSAGDKDADEKRECRQLLAQMRLDQQVGDNDVEAVSRPQSTGHHIQCPSSPAWNSRRFQERVDTSKKPKHNISGKYRKSRSKLPNLVSSTDINMSHKSGSSSGSLKLWGGKSPRCSSKDEEVEDNEDEDEDSLNQMMEDLNQSIKQVRWSVSASAHANYQYHNARNSARRSARSHPASASATGRAATGRSTTSGNFKLPLLMNYSLEQVVVLAHEIRTTGVQQGQGPHLLRNIIQRYKRTGPGQRGYELDNAEYHTKMRQQEEFHRLESSLARESRIQIEHKKAKRVRGTHTLRQLLDTLE